MKLQIALLTYATKPRGSVVHTVEVAEALQDLGHSVCIYALDKEGSGFYRSLRCPVELIPAQSAPANDIDRLIRQRIQEFVSYFCQMNPDHDIYHAQDCISANALLELRQAGYPIPFLVRTVHHIEDYNSPYLQDCQDRSIRCPDQCFCVSTHWQTRLAEQYGITAPTVLNGVNPRFSPQSTPSDITLATRWGITGSPIYLTVGGIEPRKNSITLLRAFAQVVNEYPSAQLVIAGGATLFDYQPYRDEFFAIAHTLDLPSHALILPGVIPDDELPALYRLADAFVFPSLKEGWGLVVLEALASGVPVVTSNQAPFTEFLSADEAVWVNPAEEGAIAQAMIKILQPELAQLLSKRGLQVVQQFTWENCARHYVQQYRRAGVLENQSKLEFPR